MENCSNSGRSSVVFDGNNRNLLHSQEKEDTGKTTVMQAVPETQIHSKTVTNRFTFIFQLFRKSVTCIFLHVYIK